MRKLGRRSLVKELGERAGEGMSTLCSKNTKSTSILLVNKSSKGLVI